MDACDGKRQMESMNQESQLSQPVTDRKQAARCLVLGGSGALGNVVCRQLHDAGARVAFTWHANEKAARALADELPGAQMVALDLSSIPALEQVIDHFANDWGGLDALVQCAGVGLTVPSSKGQVHHTMEQVDEPAWERMQEINVKSTFFAVRRAAARMRTAGGGNIILMGSIDGVKPVPAPVHYAAAKGALAGMTAAMAKELGKDNIRVNLLAPGILEGGMSHVLPEDLRQEYLKHSGLKRFGRFSEIAAWAAWLSLRNTYVTGQTILIDGAL
jgi:NAD(P)-dependent dehydrogenase (short-subunit alcohol dehydrogenase family)